MFSARMLTICFRNYTISFNNLLDVVHLACGSRSVYTSSPLKWINDNSQSWSLDGSEQKWSYQVTGQIEIGDVCVRTWPRFNVAHKIGALHGELPVLWLKWNSKQMRCMKTMNSSHAGDAQEDYWADSHQICPGDRSRVLIKDLIVFLLVCLVLTKLSSVVLTLKPQIIMLFIPRFCYWDGIH